MRNAEAVANVLRALRDEPRLVALVGSWSIGEAIISWNPAREAEGEFLNYPVDDSEFAGGWIGSWGYDGSVIAGYYDFALVLKDDEWNFVTNASDDRVDAVRDAMAKASSITHAPSVDYELGAFVMVPSVGEHARAVEQAREYIRAGDIFQANICARFQALFSGDPVDVFCAGLSVEPAYGVLVKNHDNAILSLSPELFLHRQGRSVLTSPIKGTVPLEVGADALRESAKNRAENTMIVDLMRNDLSKVCQPGTVEVPHHLRVERHSVWHLVSDIRGTLESGTTDHDLLEATFPAGSITGAPKQRAMEIIDELELLPRHAYTGAIGYAFSGGLELNVAIRTFEIAPGTIGLGAGGGIVIDSDPMDEVRECFTKATPLIHAIGGTVEPSPEKPMPRSQPTEFARIIAKPDPRHGIYETALVIDGEVMDAAEHLERLTRSAAELGLDLGDDWTAACAEAAARSGVHRLRVDIGPDPGFSISEVDASSTPWSLIPRIVPGGWGEHKWRDRAAIADADYLFLDENLNILETSRAAIAVVFDDGVHLPKCDGRILPSVERAKTIRRLHAQGIDVIERDIDIHELAQAAEVFVMNSIRGVHPVGDIEGLGSFSGDGLVSWLAEDHPPPVEPLVPRAPHARVVLLDNHDSFVFNLARYVRELGGEATVVLSDQVSVDDIRAMDPTHIIISPGPKTPAAAGISVQVVQELGHQIPILGVCLGHQCIAEAYGGKTVPSEQPTHGKASVIFHDGQGIYQSITGPFMAARYHSLIIAELGEDVVVTARNTAGTVMGIRHRDFPVEGIQVHPESLLTKHGHALVANFLSQSSR